MSNDSLPLWPAVVTLAANVIATGLTALVLWFGFTASLDHRFEALSQQISASDGQRQNDARAINSRVDATEQLVVSAFAAPRLGG